MTLKVVEPIEVTEAVLAASDIPEPDTAQGEVEWVSNRFSGLVLTDKTYPNQGFVHGAKVGGTTYALETLDVNIGSNGVMHKYDNTGAHIGSFSVDGAIKSFGISEILNRIVGVDPASGLVYEYNLTTEAFIGSTSIAGDVSTPQGITYGDGSYLVLDPVEKKIARFDSSFTLVSKETILDDSTDNLWSLQFISGGFCSYINRLTAELKAVRIGTSDTQWVIPLGVVAGADFNIFGHFFDGDDAFIINYDTDLAYRYVDGIYAGFYQPGDRVIKTSTHQVYQCLTATSQDPEEGATEDATATWIVVGPTNKWAMFDNLQNTKTINDTDFTVTLNPITYVNTLAVLGFSGVSSVRVEVDDTGGTTIYDKTFTASDFSAIYDHYTYVFYQIVALKKLIVEDLPPLPNTTIRVTFSGADMQIGELAFGFAVNIGTLVANGTKSDRFRYREQQYNEFGYPTGAAPIVVELNTYDVLVPKLTNPSIQKLLDGLTGKNTLWVGDIGSDQRMITYGFFERSPIPFNMPNDINYQITVRASV